MYFIIDSWKFNILTRLDLNFWNFLIIRRLPFQILRAKVTSSIFGMTESICWYLCSRISIIHLIYCWVVIRKVQTWSILSIWARRKSKVFSRFMILTLSIVVLLSSDKAGFHWARIDIFGGFRTWYQGNIDSFMWDGLAIILFLFFGLSPLVDKFLIHCFNFFLPFDKFIFSIFKPIIDFSIFIFILFTPIWYIFQLLL